MIAKAHLSWFNLKCPYLVDSKEYNAAKRRLHGAAYSDLERLRAEFDDYDDGSIPVQFYSLGEHWYCTTGNPIPALNLKGIQRHGNCYRVQKRIGGVIRKWSFKTLQEAIDNGMHSLQFWVRNRPSEALHRPTSEFSTQLWWCPTRRLKVPKYGVQ